MTAKPTALLRLALLAVCALGSGCWGTRTIADPTLRIFTEGGAELGASTTYGVVFLGRTSTSGYIEVEALYGDGPSIESTVIEPLGAGLYTAETEILLPNVPLVFHTPRPGDPLVVAGRTEEGPWEREVKVRADPRVHGIMIDIPVEIEGRTDQVGAGVYWINPEDKHDRRLLGLVTGRVKIGGRELLTVAGPEDLWRLVTHRRDRVQRRPWVYREDIM